MTALLVLPILAFSSMAVDLGAWYARGEQLQRVADAAALAAAPLLPDDADADAAAQSTIARNGVTCTLPITCTYGAVSGSTTRYRVSITDTSVEQFFSAPFRDEVNIARAATAERVRPVRMGSPRNFLGTNALLSGAARENMWVSVSGYCARNEMGDRITPRADRNGSGTPGRCTIGNPATVQPNVDYNSDGYFYAIDFPPGTTGSYPLEIFDAAHCQFESSGASDSGADNVTPRPERRYTFTVRGNDSNDPTQTSILDTRVVSPADCASGPTYRNAWRNFYTFVNPVGTYYLQVNPVIPTVQTVAEGQNQFAIRIAQPGGFSPCTNDTTTAGGNVAYLPTCPNVYAVSHLGVYANLAGATPSFFLASVGAEHAGKSMEVELFDTAEGANFIELLDPNGNPVTFTWEVACKNAKYRSETMSGCSTGEAAPGGPGYGPGTSDRLAVSGTGPRPFPELSQNGLYSNRLMRLKVTLPSDYAAQYGANTWWRLRYTKGPAAGDRTTWSISIKGDPVRLVPN